MTKRRKLTPREQKLKHLYDNRSLFRLSAITQFVLAGMFLLLSTKRSTGLYVALAGMGVMAGVIIVKRLAMATQFVESWKREATEAQES